MNNVIQIVFTNKKNMAYHFFHKAEKTVIWSGAVTFELENQF